MGFSNELVENVRNTKNKLDIIGNSGNSRNSFYFEQLDHYLLMNPNQFLEFYTVNFENGIDLWKYELEDNKYTRETMINSTGGLHRRGGINNEGIYVVAGEGSNNVKIYDMKYYKSTETPNKLKLLATFTYSDPVYECLFHNSLRAICCLHTGVVYAYDLTDITSIQETVFINNTQISLIYSFILTEDNKYYIAGGTDNIYIFDAQGGHLYTHQYTQSFAFQLAEVRPNLLFLLMYSLIHCMI